MDSDYCYRLVVFPINHRHFPFLYFTLLTAATKSVSLSEYLSFFRGYVNLREQTNWNLSRLKSELNMKRVVNWLAPHDYNEAPSSLICANFITNFTNNINSKLDEIQCVCA
jgi:hypothetical protein